MADDVKSLVEKTRRLLHGGHRGITNRLNSNPDSDDTTITVEFDVRGIKRGSVIEIGDELLYCWADADAAAKTVVVERGYLGTPDSSHTAGTTIEVNPRFPRFDIREAIAQEIRSWHPKLYAVVTKELNVASGDRAVNLDSVPTDFFHLLRILQSPLTGSDAWVRVRGRVEHNMATADFASGSVLFLNDPSPQGGRLNVTYARKFDTSNVADTRLLTTDLLLDDGQFDIPPFGAAWRLVAGHEVRRTDTEAQGEPRDAQEVPPSYILQTARQLKGIRDERIKENASVLRWRWGVLK